MHILPDNTGRKRPESYKKKMKEIMRLKVKQGIVKPPGGWNKGIKLSEEHSKAIKDGLHKKYAEGWKNPLIKYSKSKRGRIENKKRVKKLWENPEYRKKVIQGRIGTQSGEKAWKWKGGITPISRAIRGCFKYRQWRSDIFTKDDFTCVLCGQRGGDIEADHYPKRFCEIFSENNIKSLEQAEGCEEFWNINNGRVLCKKCHDKHHSKNKEE